jgi:pteridine reductase
MKKPDDVEARNSDTSRVALITGGAKRVGAAIARRLHAAGFQLVVHYRSSENDARMLQAVLNDQRPGSVALVQADLLNIEGLNTLVDETVRTFGRLDVLVNNASSFSPTPVGEITKQDWEDLIGSNLLAPLFLSQAARAPRLHRQYRRHPR